MSVDNISRQQVHHCALTAVGLRDVTQPMPLMPRSGLVRYDPPASSRAAVSFYAPA
jgi:hypothetical protein